MRRLRPLVSHKTMQKTSGEASERNIFPGLGKVPINEIRPKLLKQHLDPIEQRGVLETLRRIISRLNEIFRWAATEELIEFNPADNLGQRFSKPKKTEYASITPFRVTPLPNGVKQCLSSYGDKIAD